MAVNQQLKNAVELLKKRLNVYQTDVARKLGVSPQYLSDAINGRVAYSDELKRKVEYLQHQSKEDILQLQSVKEQFTKLMSKIGVDRQFDGYNEMPRTNQKVYDLISEKAGGNVSKFATMIGASQQVVSRTIKIDKRSGKYPSISPLLIKKMTETFDLEDGYFINNNVLNNEKQEIQEFNRPIDKAAIPYFEDVNFGCSPSGFAGAIESSRASSFLLVPGLTNDGDTFIVPARGDSMINTSNPERSIPNGSLVAIRKSKLSTPRWGEVYALSTDDGCIIKRLYPSERDGYVKCVSFNEKEFPPFELHSSEIHDVGNVVAVVSVSMWL